jgi:8-oxo-dGTP diphosphatase
MSLPPAPPRKVTRVAVGVMLRGDGSVLLADRPAGRPYPGYWEFPGGKVEAGEAVADALARELHEELGIEIGPSVPWVTFEFDYPHAYVRLHFRRVLGWRGEPRGREGQRLRFVDPAQRLPQPLLPAAVPALRWLRLPQAALVVDRRNACSAVADADAVVGLERAAPRIIVIDGDWGKQNAASVAVASRRLAARTGDLLLASGPGARRVPELDGVVLAAEELSELAPAASPGWRGVWVDSSDAMQTALRWGCDFVLVRSAALVEAMRTDAAAVPALLSAADGVSTGSDPSGRVGHGHWTDLRASLASAPPVGCRHRVEPDRGRP